MTQSANLLVVAGDATTVNHDTTEDLGLMQFDRIPTIGEDVVYEVRQLKVVSVLHAPIDDSQKVGRPAQTFVFTREQGPRP